MTAETFTTVVRPATGFSLEKSNRGSDLLDATAVSALGALTTSSSVADVLDVLSANQKRAHSVTATTIGKATQSKSAEASGIGLIGAITTSAAFQASQTGAAVTFYGTAGTVAEGTVDTDASGNVTAVTITTAGDGYVLGQTVCITEDTYSGKASFLVRGLA